MLKQKRQISDLLEANTLRGCKVVEELDNTLMIFFPYELHKINVLELLKKRGDALNLKTK